MKNIAEALRMNTVYATMYMYKDEEKNSGMLTSTRGCFDILIKLYSKGHANMVICIVKISFFFRNLVGVINVFGDGYAVLVACKLAIWRRLRLKLKSYKEKNV